MSDSGLMDDWADWQEAYRYGTFVIWPPDDVRRTVNRLRERYDPESQRICEAHITVTQPFLRPPGMSTWQQIASIVSGFETFSVRYGPLNSFLPYPCIYYKVHPPEKILALRQALHETGLFNLELPYTDGFVPHMSITDGYPDAARTREIFNHLRPTIGGGSFDCTEIAHIVPDASFRFAVVRTLALHP